MLGTYVIDWVSAADSLGNTTYGASWGDSDVSLPNFEVIGGVTDTDGPDITGIILSDLSVEWDDGENTVYGGDTVEITVKAEDAESDVEGVFIYIINPGGGNSVQTCNIGEQSGECQASFTVGSGDFQMLGTYNIDWVSAADSLGNTTYAASWGDSDVSRPGFVVGQ